MSLANSIAKAVQVVGTQKALAELIGETSAHISDFKRGRPCGYKKHAQIAAIAGEDPLRILIQGFAESLDDAVPHEKGAKDMMLAILAALPPETDEPPKKAKRTKKPGDLNVVIYE
jgi:hypothetical protein